MEGFHESIDKNNEQKEPYWYAVHTYSGYEDKVRNNIIKTIENRHLEDKILEVRVPRKEETEVRKGKTVKVKRKLFPGYVLIHMIKDDETWYIVRNTRGVTGFVGPGSKAVPLEDYSGEEEETKSDEITSVDFELGDVVIITDGPWADRRATISEINLQRGVVSIKVDTLGGATVNDIPIVDVRKIDN